MPLIFLPGIRQAFNDFNYPPLKNTVRIIYLCLFAFTFIFFGIFLFMEKRKKDIKISFNEKIITAVLIGIIFITVVPVFSIDFHCYSMQGRVMSIHHANPYLVTPNTFPDDPFLHGIFWKHRVAFYGPLWILISAVMTFFARDSVFLNLILLKLPLLTGYLLLIWQGYSLASKISPERKDLIATFLAFNPFIIVQYLIDGHNDILMFALALWAFNLVYSKRYVSGYIIFALSMLVKYTSVFIAPFLLILSYARLDRKRDVFKNAFSFILISFFVALILYLPFMQDGLVFLKNLVSHKLFFGTQGIDSNTLPYAYLLGIQKTGLLKGINLIYPPAGIISVFHFLFLTGAAVMLWRGCKYNQDPVKLMSAISGVFIAYFAFEAFSFGAWFLIWLLPFLIFSDIKGNFVLALMISAAGTVAFWKRLSFLLIGCTVVYFIYLMILNRNKKAVLI